MEILREEDYLVINLDRINIVFTTAEKDRSFNRHTADGVKELNQIRNDFNVDEVVYLRQIHSDYIFKYNGNREQFIENEGDAIITNLDNVAIGVFTADCVPVIIIDEEEGVIAAIHSGWKGTFNSIAKKTIENMCSGYGCKPKNIKVFIGAHIRQCCYEISEELKSDFIDQKNIAEDKLFKGRNLNMEECILEDLRQSGITKDNIFSLNLCTHCSEDVKLFSYRKSEGTYGRLFSFVYMK